MIKDEDKLIPVERRQQIIDYLLLKKIATISEISKKFNISEMTVRRDLIILIKEELLEKVFGGVMVNTKSREPLFNQRIVTNILEKKKIAQEALKRINDNDVIFIESGTTCLELAKLLNSKKNITVITAAPHILTELRNLKNNNNFNGEIMCCGGYLRGDPDDIFIGERAIEFFNNIKINITFFGILAINFKDGWMVSSSFEAELVRKVASVSNKTIGIMDSSKFNNTSFSKVGPINLLNEIITDNKYINKNIKNDIGKRIKLTVV